MLVDFSNVKEKNEFEAFEGMFTIECVNAEVKDTKAGTGQYIAATFKVLENGRALFTNYNIKNPNPVAVEIGVGQLHSFMSNAGKTVKGFDNVNELVGLKCCAMIRIRKDDTYGDKSEINYYKPLSAKKVSTEPVAPSDDLPF